jgi:hypothetical protein
VRHDGVVINHQRKEEKTMAKITTIGLDLAKHVFHVVCCDELGKLVSKRMLKRRQVLRFFANLPACQIGMEACASAHYWGRERITRRPYIAKEALASVDQTERPSCENENAESTESDSATQLADHKTTLIAK